MECDECKSQMVEINRAEVMAEIDDDATEGQMADYMAAQLSGDPGEWAITQITYKCENCGNVLIVTEY